MMKCIIVFFSFLLILGCSQSEISTTSSASTEPNELMEFAKASCISSYFRKKGYDLKDIRFVTAAIVAKGSYAAERYANVAGAVQTYSPDIKTKQNVDVDLFKCFFLDQDKKFIAIINEIERAEVVDSP